MRAAITFSCKNDAGSHTYCLVLRKSRFRSQNLKVSSNLVILISKWICGINVWYKTYMSGASGCLKLRVGIETQNKTSEWWIWTCALKYYCVALNFCGFFNFADRRFFLVWRLLMFAIITESQFLVFLRVSFFFPILGEFNTTFSFCV